MNIQEAMAKRHMVRKYLKKPISSETINKIEQEIKKYNQLFNLNLKLMLNNKEALKNPVKIMRGASNITNYIILAGDDNKDLAEDLGYAGAAIMLYAQTLGLNSWWVGGLYNKDVAKFVDYKKVIGVIIIGYGANHGVAHKSKQPEAVSRYEGKTPDWFKNGVEASLLAPTALNKQNYMIIGRGNKIKITVQDSRYSDVERGIIKYHFELGAGKNNFELK